MRVTPIRTKQPDRAERSLRRAAQYVRMSSDPQKYSIEIQSAAIAAYAARRNMDIVHTYSDPGRSGVRIKGRVGLKELLSDIESGRADFDCVLVFDVSRWGRFQDVDESAYHEFKCKQAGIEVHYCMEEFENDGSLASVVLKNVQRLKAAGFSRDLSRNVFLGQCNTVTLGHWRGGPAAFGLRRMIVGEDGKPKMLLQYGQSTHLKGEHIILVPGPKAEVNTVRHIFRSFVVRKRTRTQIAEELNARGTKSSRGNLWTTCTIGNLLRNEIYLGHMVFNRSSAKLGERPVENPSDIWVRKDNAFKSIISPTLFAKAQRRLVLLKASRRLTDQELLDRLAALLRRKGRLTVKIVTDCKTTPHPKTYSDRFGSLAKAWELVGFEAAPRYHITKFKEEIDRVIRSVADDTIIDLRGSGVNASFLDELHLLTMSGGLTVVVAVARAVRDGKVRYRRWEVRKLKYRKADFVLVIRMDQENRKIEDYFLFPTSKLPVGKDGKLRVSGRLFAHTRLESFEAMMKSLLATLRAHQPDYFRKPHSKPATEARTGQRPSPQTSLTAHATTKSRDVQAKSRRPKRAYLKPHSTGKAARAQH
jgi:DNA invertase Pin-like site-specific DNA recombinase